MGPLDALEEMDVAISSAIGRSAVIRIKQRYAALYGLFWRRHPLWRCQKHPSLTSSWL